ncbi:MAG: HAMP domain-containing protein [Sphingobacteriales bacterium]|nr:MAG: HAMP domain-containing protein [Sphingobacteriales bacterium]
MTLKTKLSLGVSLLITVLFAGSSVLIYLLFADFRKDEVETRLRQSGISTTRLIANLQRMGATIPQTLDESDIETLDEEVTLVFSQDRQLIYSSVTDQRFSWYPEDLQLLNREGAFFRTENGREVYGLRFDEAGSRLFTLVSASDELGKRKQQFLLYALLGTGLLFTVLAWVIPARLIRQLLRPLDSFLQQVKEVHAHTLDTRIQVQDQHEEIALLAGEFNGMLQRIEQSYERQKEFTAHASHELRTPLARLIAQLENRAVVTAIPEEQAFLARLLGDANRLSELITSLLLLARLDNQIAEGADVCRPDELLFDAAEQVAKLYPDFRMQLQLDDPDPESPDMTELQGTRSLLEIAFANLLKNAYQYSSSHRADVTIRTTATGTQVIIENDGPVLTPAEQQRMFEPFMRGQNAGTQSGLGLGLRMVSRILHKHGIGIRYEAPGATLNRFVIDLPAA